MKKYASVCALMLGVCCLSGCINLKTESEVKPIEIKPVHITVDINVKIDRALDDFFADVDKTNEQNKEIQK